MKRTVTAAAAGLLLVCAAASAQGRKAVPKEQIHETVLRSTRPLRHARGRRLGLYVWRLMSAPVPDDAAELARRLRALDERGIATAAVWNPAKKAESLATALRIGAAQKRLGLRVAVNANHCLHRFFNGDPSTAHVSAGGKRFFDTSFTKGVKIGCPFAAKHRYPVIAEQVDSFARAYQAKGIDIDFAFADWEIDGPIEWNDAWAHCKRCTRCRKNIPKIDDFTEFQKALRTVRCDMQKQVYAEPLTRRFPKILVGNYAVYPHDGWRYWYDWFEKFVEGAPHQTDHKAKHRKWFHEFALTGYTVAMPVVYAWKPSYHWSDFAEADYHWFYFMLKCASNAGRHRIKGVPNISFVSCLGALRYAADAPEKPFSTARYEELLWHMLLRGTDTFFVYSGRNQLAEELAPVHRVWSAALAHRDFLDRGTPVCFDVPPRPGAVVSGLKLGKRVLAYRTDFDAARRPVELNVAGRTLTIGRAKGRPQVLTLK